MFSAAKKNMFGDYNFFKNDEFKDFEKIQTELGGYITSLPPGARR